MITCNFLPHRCNCRLLCEIKPLLRSSNTSSDDEVHFPLPIKSRELIRKSGSRISSASRCSPRCWTKLLAPSVLETQDLSRCLTWHQMTEWSWGDGALCGKSIHQKWNSIKDNKMLRWHSELPTCFLSKHFFFFFLHWSWYKQLLLWLKTLSLLNNKVVNDHSRSWYFPWFGLKISGERWHSLTFYGPGFSIRPRLFYCELQLLHFLILSWNYY